MERTCSGTRDILTGLALTVFLHALGCLGITPTEAKLDQFLFGRRQLDPVFLARGIQNSCRKIV